MIMKSRLPNKYDYFGIKSGYGSLLRVAARKEKPKSQAEMTRREEDEGKPKVKY